MSAPELVPLIPLPEGTRVRYTYPAGGSSVTVVGRKGRPINPGQSAGFELLGEAGEVVARISRYARVEVLS